MRDILKGYKIFNIDAKKLRSTDNFFKNMVIDKRKEMMNFFGHTIKKPEQFKCLLCGSNNAEKFLAHENYLLFECRDCGLVSPNIDLGLLDEKEVCGEKSEYENVKREIIAHYQYRKDTYATERLNYISEKIGIPEKEIKLLDFACGPGYFISYLKDRGIAYKGLELADFLVKFCKESGLNVEKSDISAEKNQSYNIITAFDVLEHLRDPISIFKMLNEKLIAGGYVLAFTPNIHSMAALLMKEKQNNVYPFSHLAFFDQKSLNYLADKTGFTIQSIDYYGLDIVDYLCMKKYEDSFDYLEKLKDFIPLMQAIIDKQNISNHQRIIFQKIRQNL